MKNILLFLVAAIFWSAIAESSETPFCEVIVTKRMKNSASLFNKELDLPYSVQSELNIDFNEVFFSQSYWKIIEKHFLSYKIAEKIIKYGSNSFLKQPYVCEKMATAIAFKNDLQVSEVAWSVKLADSNPVLVNVSQEEEWFGRFEALGGPNSICYKYATLTKYKEPGEWNLQLGTDGGGTSMRISLNKTERGWNYGVNHFDKTSRKGDFLVTRQRYKNSDWFPWYLHGSYRELAVFKHGNTKYLRIRYAKNEKKLKTPSIVCEYKEIQ